jgi:hypothetical protein
MNRWYSGFDFWRRNSGREFFVLSFAQPRLSLRAKRSAVEKHGLALLWAVQGLYRLRKKAEFE